MKTRFNQRFTFSAILTLIMVCTQLTAQNIDWVVQPVITDADLIQVDENTQDEIKLIRVRNGKKWGVKDIYNNIVLPAKFDRTSIWAGGKFAQGSTNGISELYFVDNQGYEADYKRDVEPSNDKWNKERSVRKQKERMDKWYKSYRIEEHDMTKNLVSSITNAVVIPNVRLNNLNYLNENIIAYTKNNEVKIYDNHGTVVKAWPAKSRVSKVVNDRIIIAHDKKYSMYDFNMNTIVPAEYSNLYHFKGDYFGAKKGGDYYLLDSDGQVLQQNLRYVEILKNKKYIYAVKKNSKSTLYPFDESKPIEIEGNIKNLCLGNLVKVTTEDTLSGMIDMNSGDVIIPIKYRYLTTSGGVILADNIPYKIRKTKSGRVLKRGAKYGYKDVYNSTGKLILSDSIYKVTSVGKGAFLINKRNNNSKSIYSTDGELLKTLDKNEKISLAKGGYVSIAPKGSFSYKKFESWDQYMLEKESYSAILKEETYKEKSMTYYHVKKGDMEGLIDNTGNIVIPIVLDKLEFDNYDKYLPAQYKGKWGVIKNPLEY